MNAFLNCAGGGGDCGRTVSKSKSFAALTCSTTPSLRSFSLLSSSKCGILLESRMTLIRAQMIVGCIVTRSPSCSLASSAYIELGLACDLFQKAVSQSRRSRSGLVRTFFIHPSVPNVFPGYLVQGPPKSIRSVLPTCQRRPGANRWHLVHRPARLWRR